MKWLRSFKTQTAFAVSAAIMFGVNSLASASGFDITPVVTQAQSTWETAIIVILAFFGVLLGARLVVRWAKSLLAR